MAKQYYMVLFLITMIPDATEQTCDNITISDVSVSENSQLIGKGIENSNVHTSATHPKSPNRSLLEWINPPATIAALIGFFTAEIGIYIYQTTYNHLISVAVAMVAFIIVAIFNKH